MCSVFIHIALLDGYKKRVEQYINLLKESNLFYSADINLCFVGDKNIDIDIDTNNVKIYRVSNNLTDYELPTQTLLYDYCNLFPDKKILYIHTKGVGKNINLCIEDWISYMCYFLITKWKQTILYLNEYNTVGVDLREKPTLHYSGNFWWANSNYIKTLPPPNDFKNLKKYPNSLNSERHNQEFWICYNTKNHKSLWDCGINCYERHLHRYTSDKYIDLKNNELLSMSLVDLIDNTRTDKNTSHSYLETYETLFSCRKDSKNILEIGIQDGGSIKLWYDYFTNADIYGVDIMNETKVWDEIKKDRIKLYTSTNGYSKNFVDNLKVKFDVIIDDGPHTLQSMIDCINLYSNLLTEKGILIIEDVSDIKWLDILKNTVPDNLKNYVKTYDLRSNKGRWDDILFVIDKN